MNNRQTISLEERLIGDATSTMLEIKGAISVLSANLDSYTSLMGEKPEESKTFTDYLGMISQGAQTTETLLHELSVLYTKKSAAPVRSNTLDAFTGYLKSTVARLSGAFRKKTNGAYPAQNLGDRAQEAETASNSLERNLIHDINNAL